MPEWKEKRQPLPLPTRKEAVRFALASTVMEGQTVSKDTGRLLARWASHEMTGNELIEQANTSEPELAATHHLFR